MARLYRQFFSEPIPATATVTIIDGKKYAQWVKDGKPTSAPLTAGGDKIRIQAAKWYGEYRDASGKKVRKPLDEDKKRASHMLADLERGFEPSKPVHVGRPADPRSPSLAKQLDDFETYLKGKRSTEKHVRLKMNRLRTLLLDWLKLSTVADMDPTRIQSMVMERCNSERTQNHFISVAKSFARWMFKVRVAAFDSLAILSPPQVTKREYLRRPLSENEMQSLFVTTMTSKKTLNRLTGEDRYFLYQVAAITGFRPNEIADMTPAHFFLDDEVPHAVNASHSTKNGKKDYQPIPREFVGDLKEYLAGKPRNDKVWRGSWWIHGAQVLRQDLEGAGIPHLTIEADGPVHVDFYSLRYTANRRFEDADFSPEQRMKAMRHSNANLTFGTYSRKTLKDMGEAFDRVPIIRVDKHAAKAINNLQRELMIVGEGSLPAPSPDSWDAVTVFLESYNRVFERLAEEYWQHVQLPELLAEREAGSTQTHVESLTSEDRRSDGHLNRFSISAATNCIPRSFQ